ncbi:hypothetical protein [Heliorestis convoluta]|uniref:Uncharacterized protein n=1 Tax=Heliorestis convoluta TaxID=356322 RepID=A0A5Q2N8J9_9FIRM|nr:hypothetical protein [Heliorestis convoluta]QGG48580.1 hypothetical protein FTV88_2487 [Heliorestis convoluta]
MTKVLGSYIGRYTLVHVLIYGIAGMFFYQGTGYEEAMVPMDVIKQYGPLDNFLTAVVALLGQIARGALIALLLYPFYKVIVKKDHGWLLLFGLLFGLNVLGFQIFFVESIEYFTVVDSLPEVIETFRIEVPEIIVKSLLISVLFFGGRESG